MPSISISRYRAAVQNTILYVLQHRGMFPEALSEVEVMFHGHWMAYNELAGIDRVDSFNMSFAAWLWGERRLSKSAGWARAIVVFSIENGVESEKVFEDLVKEFLATWDTKS
jgi:hypothetical protein